MRFSPLPPILLALLVCGSLAAADPEDTLLWTDAIWPSRSDGTPASDGSLGDEIRLGYTYYLPIGYNDPANANVQWPVLLVLTGIGERGDGIMRFTSAGAIDINSGLGRSLRQGPLRALREGKDWNYPYIVIQPQRLKTWNSNGPVIDIIDLFNRSYRVDPDRIYMTGLCNGGSGTWRMAKDRPDILAAISPIQSEFGINDLADADRPAAAANVASLPTWIVHSWNDKSYPRRQSVWWYSYLLAHRQGLAISPTTPAQDIQDFVQFYDGYMGDPYDGTFDPTLWEDAAPNYGASRLASFQPATAASRNGQGNEWTDEQSSNGGHLPVEVAADYAPQLQFTLFSDNTHGTWLRSWPDPDWHEWMYRWSRNRTRPVASTAVDWTFRSDQPATTRTIEILQRIELPGRLDCESVDRGVEGHAYHDTAGPYDTVAGDGGGLALALAVGEWTGYSVAAVNGGYYDLAIRYRATAPARILLETGGTTAATIDLPATDGGNWSTFTSANHLLKGGYQFLKLIAEDGALDIDHIDFSSTDIVVDSTDTTRVDQTLGWSTSSSTTGYHGSGYLYAKDSAGSQQITYRPVLPSSGSYQVFIRYPAKYNYSSTVPVSVHHDGGLTAHVVDQTTTGGTWNLLGTYDFPAGVGAAVTLSTAGAPDTVIADAVRFQKVPEPSGPVDLIIDNLEPYVAYDGAWLTSSGVPGFWASDYHYCSASGGAVSATVTPPLPKGGAYEVWIHYSAKNSRDAAVPVTVNHAEGSSTGYVNMQVNGGQWNLLGIYNFSGDGSENVVIDTAGTSGWVIMDAVRFTEVATVPPVDLVIDNLDVGLLEVVGTWNTSVSSVGFYAANYAYSDPKTAATASMTFHPSFSAPIRCAVYLQHPHDVKRDGTVPVDILHADETLSSTIATTVIIDQRTDADGSDDDGEWRFLGIYDFLPGSDSGVRVRTDTASRTDGLYDASPTYGWITADAVRFVEVPSGGG